MSTMRIAICILMFSLSWTVCGAQTFTAGGSMGMNYIRYQEPSTNEFGHKLLLDGGNISLPQLGLWFRLDDPSILRKFISVEASIPIAALTSTEFRTKDSNGTLYTTQTEDIRHTETSLTVKAGIVIFDDVRIYALFERYHLQSRRANQLLGSDSGTFYSVDSSTFDEHVWASNVGLGLSAEWGLFSATSGISTMLEFAKPVSVFVSNTNQDFGDGVWGQKASGYTLRGRLELYNDFSSNFRGILGVSLAHRHWNGDGQIGDDVFGRPIWPVNDEYVTSVNIGLHYIL